MGQSESKRERNVEENVSLVASVITIKGVFDREFEGRQGKKIERERERIREQGREGERNQEGREGMVRSYREEEMEWVLLIEKDMLE